MLASPSQAEQPTIEHVLRECRGYEITRKPINTIDAWIVMSYGLRRSGSAACGVRRLWRSSGQLTQDAAYLGLAAAGVPRAKRWVLARRIADRYIRRMKSALTSSASEHRYCTMAPIRLDMDKTTGLAGAGAKQPTPTSGGWVRLTPDNDKRWHSNTAQALGVLAAHGLVRWEATGAGFSVRVLPPRHRSPPLPRHPPKSPSDPAEKLQAYYAAREWAVLRGGPACAAASIVRRVAESASTGTPQDQGQQGLQYMRLDDSDDSVLAIRHHSPHHGWAEVVTFDVLDASAVRSALQRMEQLPLEWHETRTEAEPSDEPSDGEGGGEGGWHFVARLEWPVSLLEREGLERLGPAGWVEIVGVEEGGEVREEAVRGLRMLTRGSDGLDIEYKAEDGVRVVLPWVRRNLDHAAAFGSGARAPVV